MTEKDNSPLFIVVLIRNTIDAVKFLLSKWLVLFVAGLVFGSLGILYAWMKEPSYTAELLFSSESGNDNALGGYAGLAAQFGFDIGGGGGGAFAGDNLIELLKSRKIVQQTLLSDAKGFGPGKLLIDAYVENHRMNSSWAKDKRYSNVRFVKNPSHPDRIRDSIVGAVYAGIIESQLTVDKKDKKLDYVVVKMKDLDEMFAKEFTETLVDNATKYYVDYKSSKARKNYQLISRLTDSVRGLLYGNIVSYAASQDLNVNPSRQIVRTGSQKVQVNAQANTALYTELLKQQGLSQVVLQKETPLVQIIDRPVLPLKKVKPGRLLTGIIFAFFGTCFTILVLFVRRWLKLVEKTTIYTAKTA